MAEIVYVIGAGLNQNVVDWHGFRPPLANNFFQMVLKHDKYAGEHYSNRVAPVYEYISRYWKRSKNDLRNEPFDLEECFTMLQLQQNETERLENYEEMGELARIEFQLTMFIAEFLSEFDVHSLRSEIMKNFGTIIYQEKPAILTFNYDCILERVIEIASGVRASVPESFWKSDWNKDLIDDKLLSYSHFNWNRPLAYDVKFDEVQLQQAGISRYVKGTQFYSHPENELYNWTLLKLHGSLNWFHYLPIQKYPVPGSEEKELSEDKLKEVVLVNAHWWFGEPPELHGWWLNPLIITPILYKERFYQHPVFSDIWKRALTELSECKRLVVIGYSFAPTDFNSRKLFLDAFCQHTLEELIVVNPDTSVVRMIKELSHFEKPVVICKDLEEYSRFHMQ